MLNKTKYNFPLTYVVVVPLENAVHISRVRRILRVYSSCLMVEDKYKQVFTCMNAQQDTQKAYGT